MLIARTFKHIKEKGSELQQEGTPATKKRRSKRARKRLSSPNNNEIKMRVACEAVDKTPERGQSQGMAYDLMNSSDVYSSEEDDNKQNQKKKSTEKKKNENNDNDDEDNNSSK